MDRSGLWGGLLSGRKLLALEYRRVVEDRNWSDPKDSLWTGVCGVIDGPDVFTLRSDERLREAVSVALDARWKMSDRFLRPWETTSGFMYSTVPGNPNAAAIEPANMSAGCVFSRILFSGGKPTLKMMCWSFVMSLWHTWNPWDSGSFESSER